MYDEKSSQINNIASILPFPGTTITKIQLHVYVMPGKSDILESSIPQEKHMCV